MITWKKRAEVKRNETGTFRRWESDTSYSVVETKSDFGLLTRYLAVQRIGDNGEIVISRHRTKRRALAACEINFGMCPISKDN